MKKTLRGGNQMVAETIKDLLWIIQDLDHRDETYLNVRAVVIALEKELQARGFTAADLVLSKS